MPYYIVLNCICIHSLIFFAVQKRGYVDLQEASTGESVPCSYGATLPKDPCCSLPSSWAMADPSTFLIRGESYLHDHLKVMTSNSVIKFCFYLHKSCHGNTHTQTQICLGDKLTN